MTLSKQEAKLLLERIIFLDERGVDWAQDVWDMSPTLGETAVRLIEVMDGLIESCSEEKLENYVQRLYQELL
ncbi:MAG: hypothetical protein KME07_06015 [Pegethrix bostrychoides GSE-TBD4-15B]|jgi:hypothetical protein|uniref:Uncharacterized protein n=1 Tax=Pegethrix bostrychoides GSE-TBD4-15B TaxID=2839662 RepID=A0A951P8J4_9CYAN|nr:hypothetical protein [Pegethrix bostrychoides GSE-TBD4-15B]